MIQFIRLHLYQSKSQEKQAYYSINRQIKCDFSEFVDFTLGYFSPNTSMYFRYKRAITDFSKYGIEPSDLEKLIINFMKEEIKKCLYS
ncbi:MAG: hypothetical protein ACOC1K_02220 [Nanoarchaeota archaeon]